MAINVPSYVRANARRGLDLLEFAGDGLRPRTIREARAMARGEMTADKVRRMAAWLARHEVDLRSPRANAYLDGTSDRPTAGQVAWLLWGGDLGRANRGRAKDWADRTRDRLIGEGKLTKAEPSEVKVGTSVQYAVPKPPDKVEAHNERYTGKGQRATVRMLEAVFERGIGAYRTNPGSVRPTVTSAEQWAYARVNAFLTALRTGRFPRRAFDTDLLPEGHPLSSKD
jgi:hypothetical protein